MTAPTDAQRNAVWALAREKFDSDRTLTQGEFIESYGDAVEFALDLLEVGTQDRTRRHPFPGNVLVHVENMSEGDSDEDGPTQARAETRTVTENLDAAMVLTSDTGRMSLPRYRHVDGALSRFEVEPLHRPVLDLDMPCTLLPSSTPGHHHLLIDSPMPWSTYLDLLRALVAAGLVESGYVGAAEERGHTGVRVPWFRKGDVPPNVDGTVPSVPFGDVEPFGVAS